MAFTRSQIRRCCSSERVSQPSTSSAVRPQPLHTLSPRLVEQKPMQGVLGVSAATAFFRGT